MTYLYKRGSIYYFRMSVPQDLRANIIDQLSQYDTTDMESLVKNVFNLSPEGKGYQQACLKLLRFEAEHCQALIDLTQGDTTSHEAFANAIQSYHHQQRPPRQCHLIYRSKC